MAYKKIQAELEAIRKEEEENAVTAFKVKLAQDRAAARAIQRDELEKSTYQQDKKGGKTTDWQAAINKALSVINQDQAAYNDWRNAMSSLLNMFSLLNKAMVGSIDKHATQPLTEFLVDQVALGLIKDSFIKPPAEITLPSLAHNVQFSDDNKLNIAPLVRSDHPHFAESEQIRAAFKEGIVCWLKDNGYTQDPDDEMKFVNSRGVPLDKAAFYELKADPVNGLDAFLSDEEPELTFTNYGL